MSRAPKFVELEGGLSYHEATLRRLAGTIPDFLRREGHRLTHEEARSLGRGQISWAPFRDRNAPRPQTNDKLFVYDPAMPVVVNVRIPKGPPLNLTTYDNLTAFEADHDHRSYPVVRYVSDKEQTIVLTSAKPWATDHDQVETMNGQKVSRKAAKLLGLIVKEALKPTGRSRLVTDPPIGPNDAPPTAAERRRVSGEPRGRKVDDRYTPTILRLAAAGASRDAIVDGLAAAHTELSRQDFYNVSYATLQRLVDAGKLSKIKDGRRATYRTIGETK